MKFRFDLVSFLIGMAIATVVWWIISLLRPILERWLELRRQQRQENELKHRTGLEGDYLQAVYKHTQGLHLAASLFPLDEIIETPRLLAPPINPEPNTPHPHEDIVEQTLPYLPDFPELGAYFAAPTLSLLEAISGGMNLVIIGQPGTGKSTALAHLAAQLSNPVPATEQAPSYVPFLIQAADLGSILTDASKTRDLLAPILDQVTQIVKSLDAPRLRKFTEFNFANGRALLLLDGVDELPQASVQEVKSYLQALLGQFPRIRVILSACPEYVDGLSELGFATLAIMPWGPQQQAHFLTIWSGLWQRYLSREAWANQLNLQVDSLLLNRWLAVDNFALTPLELTLKVWGAYAGDVSSGSTLAAVQAHIARLTPAGISQDVVSTLAMQAAVTESPLFDGRQATDWIKTSNSAALQDAAGLRSNPFGSETPLDNPDQPTRSGQMADTRPTTQRSAGQTQQLSNISVISELTISGLLTSHSDNLLSFAHPIFMACLAGKALASQPAQSAALMNQKAWVGQSASLQFMARFGDVTEIISKLLAGDDPILMRPQLTAGRLLRDTNQPQNSAWRTAVIAAMLEILRNEDHPLSLRGAALAALALSGDGKMAALFRQLLLSESNEMRQLAALGSGLTRDSRALETLVHLTTNSLEATRRAACLALVEIGSPPALEQVAVFLLHGDEQIRIYAAESLANNLKDGREALREGIESEDILVRRAIIFGLARIDEPWSVGLLEKSQVNDEQWAVRNLAVETLTARLQMNPHIPRKLSAPHENTWLIEFASKYGMGISPSQPVNDILLLALKDKNTDYFKPALNYLVNSPSTDVFAGLYPFIYGVETDTREASYQALVEIGRSGYNLPSPRQFGLG